MASDKLSRRSQQSEDIIFTIIYIISQCNISESVIYVVTIHYIFGKDHIGELLYSQININIDHRYKYKVYPNRTREIIFLTF